METIGSLHLSNLCKCLLSCDIESVAMETLNTYYEVTQGIWRELLVMQLLDVVRQEIY